MANQYRAKDQTRRCSEREPADSLSDKFNIIGGWLPSLSSFLVVKPSTHRFRKAAFKTLALSIPALLIVCSTVAGWDGPAHAIILWPLQILVGFVCMAAFIWFSARFVAAFCARHFLGLGFYFVLVFLIGAVSGSASSLGLYQESSIRDFVVKPVYWLSIFGIAPAFILGVIGAVILRRHEDAT